MELKYLRGKFQLKQEGDVITVIASDETLDRHGDVLPVEQWDLSKFKGSPRMLVDHDHRVQSIVGKWENPRIEGKQLLMDANFHGITDLSKAVKEMVAKGYLDTVSVGFIPRGPEKDGDHGSLELIETSWVTVPANPSARVVKELMDKEMPTEEQAKVKAFVGEKAEEPAPVKSEEEIKEVITSIEQFKALADKPEVVACTYALLSQLITDSEQLKTLTADNKKKVEIASREKLLRLTLKAVASHSSHLLRELNKSSH